MLTVYTYLFSLCKLYLYLFLIIFQKVQKVHKKSKFWPAKNTGLTSIIVIFTIYLDFFLKLYKKG